MRLWPFKRKFQRDAERAGRMMMEGFAEGIRQGQEGMRQVRAGEAADPNVWPPRLSPEALAWAERVAHRSFPSLYEEPLNRSHWTSPNTWRDPDCVECGGEGAPCCEPPDYPYPTCCGGTGMADYAAVPCPNPDCPVPPRGDE